MPVTVTTTKIPDRAVDQDEALIVIAFRRTDPENPYGDATPDLGNALSQPHPAFVAELAAFCAETGFDVAQSYMTVAGVTDVEQSGAITISDLQALLVTQEPTPETE